MTYFEGDLVRLRPIEPDDVGFFTSLEYDFDAIRRGAGFVPVPYSREKLATWVREQANKEMQNDAYRLVAVRKSDGEPVGVINTHSIDRRVGLFGYGIQVNRAHRRQGYGVDTVRALIDYFFNELRYQKCNVEVYSFNEASLAMHRKLGFTQEGQRRRMKYSDGEFHDDVLFGMTVEEFRPMR